MKAYHIVIVFKPSEPKDTQWRTFPDTVFLDEAHLVHDSQFVDVVVVERVLPSSSIKRAVREIAAQWKEEYINDSLPNAPLKETVYGNMLFIGTSSAKLANDVMMYIKQFVIDGFNPDTHIIKPFCIKNISTWLHDVLWENVNLGTNAKLYGIKTGRKISIDDALGTWTDLTWLN